MKTKRKRWRTRRHDGGGPISGGIRVCDELGEEGCFVEVLEDCSIIWGLHNDRCWRDEVKAGFRFYDHDMVGSWHDVIPKYERPDGIYMRKLEMPATKKMLSGDDLYAWNKKQGFVISHKDFDPFG